MLDLSKLNKTIWGLPDPTNWAKRYSDRVTIATPLFVEIDDRSEQEPVGRLLDITGGADPDWSPLSRFDLDKGFKECAPHIPKGLIQAIRKPIRKGDHATAAALVIASMAAQHGDQWGRLLDDLQEDRYEANAWFERDRKQLTLLDLFSGQYIVELHDSDVDDAIESGYLSRPRLPRPSDSDWLAPLLDYAKSQGLIQSTTEMLAHASVEHPPRRARERA